MVLTRAMTRKLREEEAYAKAGLTIEALKTPGILSQIARNLDPDDPGLKGMFLLINCSRCRNELEPYKAEYIQTQQKRKNDMLVAAFCNELNKRFHRLHSFQYSGRRRCEHIVKLYEYMAARTEIMRLISDNLKEITYRRIDFIKREILQRRFDSEYKKGAIARLDRAKGRLQAVL